MPRRTSFSTLALLIASVGCDRLRDEPPAPPPAEASEHASVAPSSSSTTSAPPRPSSSVPPRARPRVASSREGETSVEALFERARAALQATDDAEVVRCLFPEARRAWLGEALLAIEIEAQVPRYEDSIARRRALGALRDRVVAHLAEEGPASRPRELTVDAVEAAILERVDAPDVLLAELLGVSRRMGHPLDPVGAATSGEIASERAPRRPPPFAVPRPPDRAGLARALRRIERSSELAEVHLVDDRGIALVRGADGGLEPIRLVRRGDTVWIDES